jgi:hypothetical protein
VNWVIYALKNPRTNEIRYIGWTGKTVERRLHFHLTESIRLKKTRKQKWIMSLLGSGLTPLIEVIESGDGAGYKDAERRWIAFYRANGARLVNGTDGGDGTPGWGTHEQRSEVAKKRDAKLSPAERSARSKKGADLFIASRTPEQRSQWSEAQRAKTTPEQLSEWAKKAWAGMTPEQRTELRKKTAENIAPEQFTAAGKKAYATKTAEQRAAFSRAGNAKRWAAKNAG